MQLLTILLATTGIASAADIFRTTGDNCSGSLIGCSGIQENVCCAFSVARSQIRWNLPANSRGQGWSGAGCTASSGTFKNPTAVTGRCITFSWPVSSAKWLTGGGTKVKARNDVEDENCAEPNAAVYELDGVEHSVKIPEGKAKEVESWLEEGQWEKLGALERL
ncbi:hypothetical protein BDV96DRAFT_602586 [Lophiotrema nucula]|uniref:Uncharacterized protein n=1 Tax=Lophiotrema nucula TaxID=690887 RepID=A0A6A5YZ22_9PLEO|nr:hypothetical protein BDV96DRAFT_602586 [Lophiotrema nucula]